MTFRLRHIASVSFLFFLLFAGTGAVPGPQTQVIYPSRIPPKLCPADPDLSSARRQAAIRAARFPRSAYVYTRRKAVFQLHEDQSCTISLQDEIYIRKAAFTFQSFGRNQFKKARVVLPDERTFETVPQGLPSLPAGTFLTLYGTVKVLPPKLLPLQQIVYDMQKAAPIARFEIEFPSQFRHKFYHVPASLIGSRREADGRIFYSWDGPVRPQVPCQSEAYPRSSRMRLVLTTLSSWDELHRWALETMKPEERLDELSRKQLLKLTSGISEPAEKVRRIYDYLNRIRYLTVPVGEAKFRPQQISAMIRNGYGDCKDKSNALYVFCRELGIPAERVLVNSDGQVDSAFPSWQFNHMIVRIPELPGYPDGLWLDAAGGQAPFGELPAGTLDSVGLALSERPHFRKVEVADPEKVHSQIREHLKIGSSGKVDLQVRMTGLFASRFRIFLNRSGNRLKTELEALLDSLIPGAEMKFFQFHSGSSYYDFRAALPLARILPAMVVRNEFVKPFIPSSISRPIRLYDGHQLTFSRRVVAEGRTFKDFSWQIRRERYFAELKVRDNQIDYSFGLLRVGDNQISPLLYKEIRSALNQLRLRLNAIQGQP